ncbi:MAG TPA: hypothetical protein VI479_05870 [Blastocatellia bacterium]
MAAPISATDVPSANTFQINWPWMRKECEAQDYSVSCNEMMAIGDINRQDAKTAKKEIKKMRFSLLLPLAVLASWRFNDAI